MAHQILIKPVRIITTDDAALYCGSLDNLKRMVNAGWVSALKGKSRGMDFDIKDLDVALDRVKLDGWPS